MSQYMSVARHPSPGICDALDLPTTRALDDKPLRVSSSFVIGGSPAAPLAVTRQQRVPSSCRLPSSMRGEVLRERDGQGWVRSRFAGGGLF